MGKSETSYREKASTAWQAIPPRFRKCYRQGFLSAPGMRTNVELLSAKELSDGVPKSDDSLRVVGHSENTKAQMDLK